jgi:precorrin-2 dehydrogenase/sirohydrochlorin ferrochelatase
MNYTPLFVNLQGKKILLIGGGKTATAKARYYRDSGAQITCIADHISDELAPMLHHAHRRLATGNDISADYFLTVIATNNPEFNKEISDICRNQNLLFCNCSNGLTSNFIHGAILREGCITVAINSLGVPTISTLLKEQISKLVTPELAAEADICRNLRQENKLKNKKAATQKAIEKRVNK